MPLFAGTILTGSQLRTIAPGVALRLDGASSGYVALAPADAAGATTFVLPNSDGSAGQSLITDGAGNLSFATPTGTGSATPGGDDTQVQFNDAGQFAASNGLTWNNSTNTLNVNGIVSSNQAELCLEQTGDQFGATRMRLRNRSGFNGCVVENAALDLVDVSFVTAAQHTAIIRAEFRAGAQIESANSSGELQFWPSASQATFVVGSALAAIYTDLKLADGADLIVSTSIGTKLATGPDQKLGFFGATPATQRAKANYNNWSSLADVVQALVDLGLFDQT